MFDLENDGDMDLLVVSQKPIRPYGPPSITRLYKNEMAKGNYLKVKLKGNASTLSAFGTRIELYADSLYINHEIDGGNTSHLSHNSRIAHFGLGQRNQIDSLLITWPGGKLQMLYNLDSNQKLFVEEKTPFKESKIENYLIIIVLKAFCYFVFIILGSLLLFKFKKKYF